MNNGQSTRKRKRNRRVPGSRSYKDYSIEMLEVAVDMVEKNIISSRQAEKQFGIPRRTILNKAKKIHMKPAGGQKKLTDEEEKKLVDVLIASGDYGSPMTKWDLKMLVFKYLEKNSRTDLFNNKMPGDAWVDSFLKRHSSKLTIRTTQNIKQVRAAKGLKEMEIYFNNLQETLKYVPPTNILNYDETNLADNPGNSKCVFRRGIKYPERVLNSSKSCISIMFTVCAAGYCLPTYVVYKATNLYSEWVEGGPEGTRYNCTKSGWFDSVCFEDYFKTIVLDWAKKVSGPKVVIGDNLSSHLNIEVVELCQKNDIKFVFLPPNSTHLTQPLDLAYFAPLKREWKKILLQYKIMNPGQSTLNKKHFPKLLVQLADNIKLKESNNIKSGFRAAGIWPVNPRNVFKRIPEYFSDVDYEIDTALLDYLKETRAPKPILVKKSKKLRTEPGKSVCIADILGKTDCPKTIQHNKSKKKVTAEFKLTGVDYTDECVDVNHENEINILNQNECILAKKSLKEKPQKAKTQRKKNNNNNIEIRAKCDNNFVIGLHASDDQKNEEIIDLDLEQDILDEKTGKITNYVFKWIENTRKLQYDIPSKLIKSNSSNNSQLPLLYSSVIHNPDSLNKLCIKAINIHAHLASPQNTSVCVLNNNFKNTNQNVPFRAMDENNLPICLKSEKVPINLPINELKLSTQSPHKLIITSDVKIASDVKVASLVKVINVKKKVTGSTALQMKLGLKQNEKDVKQYSAARETDIYNKNASTSKGEIKEKKQKNVISRANIHHGNIRKIDLNSREKVKSTKKKTKNKKKITYMESSSENSDVLSYDDTDNSEYETFDDYISTCLREQAEKENLEPEIEFVFGDVGYFTGDVDLQKNAWILAKFATKKSLKHFVGRVLYLKNNIPTVKFVRKVNTKRDKGLIFTYPNVDDIYEMKHLDDIVLVLPEPNISRRGHIVFDIDLSHYNIQ